MTSIEEFDKNFISSWNSTFDTKTALSGFYLWLLFGFLSVSVSCDIQKWMSNKIWFRHLMGIIAFFFLFSAIDTTSSNYNIGIIWTKTFVVYGIFLLMTKSRAYFSVPVLLLLVLDQSLKSQKNYLEKEYPTNSNIQKFEKWRGYISLLMGVLIIIGFIDYIIEQRKTYKSNFEVSKLLFGYGCKNIQ